LRVGVEPAGPFQARDKERGGEDIYHSPDRCNPARKRASTSTGRPLGDHPDRL